MISIDEIATEAGITLERDVPVKDQRTCKWWALLIGTARKLEAHHNREEQESARVIRDLQGQVNKLQALVARQQHQLDRHQLDEAMRKLELKETDRLVLSKSLSGPRLEERPEKKTG